MCHLSIVNLFSYPSSLDIFLALVTSSTEIGNTRPSGSHPESVAKIHEVSFYSLTSATWDDISATTESLIGPDAVGSSVRDNYAQTTMAPQVFEHPCLPLTKILSSGSFYYAIESHWDLSSRLATRLSRDPASARDVAKFDERFIWNEYIIRSLLDFRERLDEVEREDLDRCQFIVCKVLLASKLKINHITIRSWPSKVMLVFSPWPCPPHRRMEHPQSPPFP